MEQKPQASNQGDRSEAASTEVPPKKDPTKAAGSLNPKEKAPFYEAVVQKGKRKRY